jgi:AcrR family transcriptional regulator
MPRKPVQQRALATVEAIVEAGFMAVARHGMAGTTTRHIATLAGISVGSLYEYFENKEAIYAAMTDKLVADVVGAIRPLVPQLLQMEIAPAIRLMLHTLGALLQANDGRYLRCAQEGIQARIQADLQPIGHVLRELIMQYVMQHPRFMRLQNLPTMGYIFIHGGMFALMHYLNDPQPPIGYEALVDGLAQMVSHHAEYELLRLDGKVGAP